MSPDRTWVPEPMMDWIYVAGPYTHPDPVTNTRDAIFAAEEIIRLGKGHPIIPHLTHLWHLVEPHGIDFWYEYDIELLRRCNKLLRLPGESSGADNEVEWANLHRIPVYYSIDELP